MWRIGRKDLEDYIDRAYLVAAKGLAAGEGLEDNESFRNEVAP